MLISNISVSYNETHVRVSALIGVFPLWFKFSLGHTINEEDATPFLMIAMTHSMMLGEDLVIDERYYVSEKVFNNLPLIQEVINCWNPVFKKIKVHARTRSDLPAKKGGASFFSGGVDSIYTLLKHQDEIDHLILVNGFDFNINSAVWKEMVKRNQEIAEIFNKKLIVVETNLKEFNSWFTITRFACFGSILSGIAQMLDFSKVHISAANTYEKIYASGSNALLDPLWSTEACDIFHTGLEADRAKKIQLIKNYPLALHKIWVCTKDPKVNCGKCDKCIRTYVAMKLNDVDDFKFANPVSVNDIRKIVIDSEHSMTFFENFRALAAKKSYLDIEYQLRRLIFKFKFKAFVKDLDTYLFNSRVQNWKKSRLDPRSEMMDIWVLPRYTDEMVVQELRKYIASAPRVESQVAIGSVFN